MLSLSQSTEVRRPLPKAQLYKRFGWSPSHRESFDGDVARLDFVNWISPHSLPAIAEGTEVQEIFVIEISLKRRDFDNRNIILLAKSIPQHIVYLLRHCSEAMLAVYYVKLFTTVWKRADDVSLQLTGLNLDTVWENIVRQIGNITPYYDSLPDLVGTSLRDVEPQSNGIQHGEAMSLPGRVDAMHDIQHTETLSLQDQIQANDERLKILRQIVLLEGKIRSSKQPRYQRELYAEIKKLKEKLNG